MPRNNRPSETLEVSHAEAERREQAAYMFGFKCFLYTRGTDDLLCYPAAAPTDGNALPLGL
jgi:hypothetical protein